MAITNASLVATWCEVTSSCSRVVGARGGCRGVHVFDDSSVDGIHVIDLHGIDVNGIALARHTGHGGAALLSAVATTAAVIYTGHSGAKSAWADVGKERKERASSGGRADGSASERPSG